MNPPRPRLILSALKGGAGKTSLSLGLAATWRSKDLRVVPFKKGPDYIDANWLTQAAGTPCSNLDPFLVGWPILTRLFWEATGGDTVALIEGNRGLFDGLDISGSTSTAELAKRLDSPVILVLDCTKATRTVAALALGCLNFDPEVNLAGVVLNQIAGARHERVIRQTLEQSVGVRVFGSLPRFARPLPERHLGLIPPQEHPAVKESIDWLADLVRKHLDTDSLLELARSAPEMDEPARVDAPAPKTGLAVRLGVVSDAAFQFYYPENIEALKAVGAEVVLVSALTAPALPALDGLYIGGGFPETQAEPLAANESFRRSVREAVEAGLPVYAECGGLMYLGRSIEMGGVSFEMAGALPFDIEVHKKPQGHGYTRLLVDRPNPFYPVGSELKGHEFHYSRVINLSGEQTALAFKMKRGEGIEGGRDGIVYKNTLATYSHVHALGTPLWAEGIVRAARRFRGK